ncbi:hypothetical protein D9M68_923310 [compost metagenome]
MGERDGGTDRAVAAHAEVTGVVEEDQAGGAAAVHRLAQQGTHHRVVAARFVGRQHAVVVEVARKEGLAFAQGAVTQRRPAGHHQTRGLALGVGIDDLHLDPRRVGHGQALPGQLAYQRLNSSNWWVA